MRESAQTRPQPQTQTKFVFHCCPNWPDFDIGTLVKHLESPKPTASRFVAGSGPLRSRPKCKDAKRHIPGNFWAKRSENRNMNRQDAKNAKETAEPDIELDDWASRVVDAALEVHRILGPGFIESIYEEALCVELGFRGVPLQSQVLVRIEYKARHVGQGQLDLLIGGRLVVELKAVETLLPIHFVQVRSYLLATHNRLGLLINFNVPLLRHGIRRIIVSS